MAMEKIGGLWEKKDKKGKPFLSGIIGGKSVIVFQNTYKQSSNRPDWIVYTEKDRESLPPKDEGNVPF